MITKDEPMTVDMKPPLKLVSFIVLCWAVGFFMTNRIASGLVSPWAALPAVALLLFVGYRTARVKLNREQMYLALLLAILTTAAVGKLLS